MREESVFVIYICIFPPEERNSDDGNVEVGKEGQGPYECLNLTEN